MAEHSDALQYHRSEPTPMSAAVAAVESPWIPESAKGYAGWGIVVGPSSSNVLHPSRSALGAPKAVSRQRRVPIPSWSQVVLVD